VYLDDLQVIREQPGTTAHIVILPYKEEVAGSIGHRSLQKHLQTVICAHVERARKCFPALMMQPSGIVLIDLTLSGKASFTSPVRSIAASRVS
jgi:hypothetical protein